MDQKKHLIAGVSAFALTCAIGLIVGTTLVEKAALPRAEHVEQAIPTTTITEEKAAQKSDAAFKKEQLEAEALKTDEKVETKDIPVTTVKTEDAKTEAPKAEAKVETKDLPATMVKTEVAKAEASKAEAKVEAKDVSAPTVKTEVAKAEAPKVDEKDEAKTVTPTKVEAKSHSVSWSYTGKEGPAHWGDLAEEFSICKTGTQQSPIDMASATIASDIKLTTLYKPVELDILNNGHTVQFNVHNGSKLVDHGKTYQLKQVQFHTPSEHVFDGKTYPMEAQFVHQSEDGKLAILGVFFDVGRKNLALKPIVDNAPMRPSPAATKGVQIDPTSLLPKNKKLIRYNGSLTTPPCSEGVLWHLFVEPQHASLAQIAKLHKAMGDNVRPIQAINDRKILKSAK